MPEPAAPGRAVRYRFGSFVLAPGRRQLLADGVEVRLIPRYFDLLVFLVECRHRAVHRQEIFDRVWSDVIVSDGALSQAVRTLRRALGDEPRDPRFIRTVSRHGYQFVHPEVREEAEEDSATPPQMGPDADRADDTVSRPQVPAFRPSEGSLPAPGSAGEDHAAADLVERLLATGPAAGATDEERRDAAEQLHSLGTAGAIEAVRARPRSAEGIALLRDTRWDVPGAGEVPLRAADNALAVATALVRLRLRRAARLASSRWASASAGGAIAGVVAGMLGGFTLLLLPGSRASASVIVVLALVGGIAGALGAAGVGAGLAAAEALARSQRALGLVACGGAGGTVAGLLGQGLVTSVLGNMFGQQGLGVGGGVEGLVLGSSAGVGYAIGTVRLAGGGMATPHGRRRLGVALLTGACCAAAGIGLALLERNLVAASLDALAGRFVGASVGLEPIAHALGEGELRPITRTLVSGFEGLLFGTGLVLGLTRRPRVRG